MSIEILSILSNLAAANAKDINSFVAKKYYLVIFFYTYLPISHRNCLHRKARCMQTDFKYQLDEKS